MRFGLHLVFLSISTCLMIISCTSSRWIITDENALNPNEESTLIEEKVVLLVESQPNYETPQIVFQSYLARDREFNEWIETERTVQQYRPKWGFMFAGLAASAYMFAAANTTDISPDVDSGHRTVMNISAGLLATVSILNMKPTGEPIFTGEKQLMRESGYVILSDTTKIEDVEVYNGLTVDLEIAYEDEIIYSESRLDLSSGRLELNLSFVSEAVKSHLDDEDNIILRLTYNGNTLTEEVRIKDFLEPHILITSPIAVLRNTRQVNEQNIVTEVGQGSSLRLIHQDDEWYRAQFGGSEVFITRQAGEIEWRSSDRSGLSAITEFAEVPFGHIDVENSVPILKANNPNDRALILTNGFSGDVEPRQYLDRDHELFRFYMRSALQMNREQILTLEMDTMGHWKEELEQFALSDSVSSLHVYLSGYGYQTEIQEIGLHYVDSNLGMNTLSGYLFGIFEDMNPESMFLYVDLDFSLGDHESIWSNGRSGAALTLLQTANQLLRRLPNTAIIFSNRPGQRSSVYAASGLENRRHHIFSYYLADSIKRRNVRIADIVRHLENNVDYTSRRYHDRPQEIIVFGNTTLSIDQ